jgi:hypothetical protein
MASMASSSTWVWSQEYGLYYDPATQRYAKPQSDGTYIYSPATTITGKGRTAVNYSELDTQPPTDQLWPSRSTSAPSTTASPPSLRLVVIASACISPPQSVAVLSSRTTSIGRDKSFQPAIRLKELAVSKTHAYVFYDYDSRDWKVTDCASMHGTFLRGRGRVEEEEIRLSESKISSKPFKLDHGE